FAPSRHSRQGGDPMNVSDLQQLLANLAPLLETFGAKTAAVADLKAVRDGLAPFSQLSLKDFAGFLARANAYQQNGEVPVKPPRGSGSGTAGTRRAPGRAPATGCPPPDVAAVAQQVRALYERAADPATTDEVIDQQTASLGQLSKDGLVA